MECPKCSSLVASTWRAKDSNMASCYRGHVFQSSQGPKVDIYSKFCPACSLPVVGTTRTPAPNQEAFCAANHYFNTASAVDTHVASTPLKLGASARLVESKNWISKVKTKNHTPEGLFTKSAGAIAEGIKAQHDDLKGAMSALNFYYNRKGENRSAEDNTKWEAAKKKLRNLYGEKDEN